MSIDPIREGAEALFGKDHWMFKPLHPGKTLLIVASITLLLIILVSILNIYHPQPLLEQTQIEAK